METTRRPVFQKGQEDLSLSKSYGTVECPVFYIVSDMPCFILFSTVKCAVFCIIYIVLIGVLCFLLFSTVECAVFCIIPVVLIGVLCFVLF